MLCKSTCGRSKEITTSLALVELFLLEWYELLFSNLIIVKLWSRICAV
jgi:hypothetical protein